MESFPANTGGFIRLLFASEQSQANQHSYGNTRATHIIDINWPVVVWTYPKTIIGASSSPICIEVNMCTAKKFVEYDKYNVWICWLGCVLILVQLANTCQHYWNILGFPHQSAIVSWLDSFIMGPKQYICICIFACIECFALWKACRGWKTQCRNGWPTIETFWGNTWHWRTKPRLGRIIDMMCMSSNFVRQTILTMCPKWAWIFLDFIHEHCDDTISKYLQLACCVVLHLLVVQ